MVKTSINRAVVDSGPPGELPYLMEEDLQTKDVYPRIPNFYSLGSFSAFWENTYSNQIVRKKSDNVANLFSDVADYSAGAQDIPLYASAGPYFAGSNDVKCHSNGVYYVAIWFNHTAQTRVGGLGQTAVMGLLLDSTILGRCARMVEDTVRYDGKERFTLEAIVPVTSFTTQRIKLKKLAGTELKSFSVQGAIVKLYTT